MVVAIDHLEGNLTIEGGSGSSVEVEVQLRGADASKLRIDRSPVRGRESLRVIYPDDDIIYPPLGRHSNSEFSMNEDGTWSDGHGRSRRVRVRGSGSGTEAYADIVVKVPRGQRVATYVGVGTVEVNGADGDILVDAASADVSLKGSKGGLKIDTGSGDVTATDAAGSLDIETGSGDVILSNYKGTQLDVETGSGNIKANAVEAERASFNAGSGDITVAEAQSSDVNIETGSGNVELALLSDVEYLKVDTGSGDVRVKVPETLGAEIRLETGSGDFDVDFPVQLVRKGESTLVAKVGDGKGRVSIETGSGDVVLRR
jgi:lia operon protein LiaG